MDKNRNARLALESAMNRAGVGVRELEKNGVMNKKTFYSKKKNMGKMKLSDLLRIDEVAPFSEREILVLFGKRDY